MDDPFSTEGKTEGFSKKEGGTNTRYTLQSTTGDSSQENIMGSQVPGSQVDFNQTSRVDGR